MSKPTNRSDSGSLRPILNQKTELNKLTNGIQSSVAASQLILSLYTSYPQLID